jgi:hypothetical protein
MYLPEEVKAEPTDRAGFGGIVKPMTVRIIITDHLRRYHYDGLAGDECGCGIDDLFDCAAYCGACQPAYKWECEGCKIGESEDSCEFHEYGGGCYRPRRQR